MTNPSPRHRRGEPPAIQIRPSNEVLKTPVRQGLTGKLGSTNRTLVTPSDKATITEGRILAPVRCLRGVQAGAQASLCGRCPLLRLSWALGPQVLDQLRAAAEKAQRGGAEGRWDGEAEAVGAATSSTGLTVLLRPVTATDLRRPNPSCPAGPNKRSLRPTPLSTGRRQRSQRDPPDRPVLVGRRQLRRVLAVPLCLPPRQESGRGVIQVVELLGVRPEKLAGRHLDDIEAALREWRVDQHGDAVALVVAIADPPADDGLKHAVDVLGRRPCPHRVVRDDEGEGPGAAGTMVPHRSCSLSVQVLPRSSPPAPISRTTPSFPSRALTT